jgi:hypothetical protein
MGLNSATINKKKQVTATITRNAFHKKQEQHTMLVITSEM